VSAETAPVNGPGTVGAVLAGGAGRRIGGDKATVAIEGRPLVQWVIDAVTPVTESVALIAKPDTLLPHLDAGVSLWLEPDAGFHPLLGVLHALRCADGRPVLVVAGDMPLLTTDVLAHLAQPSATGSHGRVANVGDRLQPLCARYEPSALEALAEFDREARATDTVLAIGVEVVDFDDPLPFFNVNDPSDLLTAGAELKKRLAAD